MTMSDLKAAAACALTSGAGFKDSEVREALRHGLEAARLGGRVPVSVLLDMWAILRNRFPTYRGGAGVENRNYDEWIVSLCDVIRRSIRIPAELSRINYVPMLLRFWPEGGHGNLHEWATAY